MCSGATGELGAEARQEVAGAVRRQSTNAARYYEAAAGSNKEALASTLDNWLLLLLRRRRRRQVEREKKRVGGLGACCRVWRGCAQQHSGSVEGAAGRGVCAAPHVTLSVGEKKIQKIQMR
jgi:hypothetical protein